MNHNFTSPTRLAIILMLLIVVAASVYLVVDTQNIENYSQEVTAELLRVNDSVLAGEVDATRSSLGSGVLNGWVNSDTAKISVKFTFENADFYYDFTIYQSELIGLSRTPEFADNKLKLFVSVDSPIFFETSATIFLSLSKRELSSGMYSPLVRHISTLK